MFANGMNGLKLEFAVSNRDGRPLVRILGGLGVSEALHGRFVCDDGSTIDLKPSPFGVQLLPLNGRKIVSFTVEMPVNEDKGNAL